MNALKKKQAIKRIQGPYKLYCLITTNKISYVVECFGKYQVSHSNLKKGTDRKVLFFFFLISFH